MSLYEALPKVNYTPVIKCNTHHNCEVVHLNTIEIKCNEQTGILMGERHNLSKVEVMILAAVG